MAYFDLTEEQLEDVRRTEARKRRQWGDDFAVEGHARQKRPAAVLDKWEQSISPSIEELHRDKGHRLSGALLSAVTAFPEAEGAARDYALAMDSGIPMQLIRENSQARKQAETIRLVRGKASVLEMMESGSPIASEYLRTSGIMPLVSDEPESLGKSEGLFRDAVNGYRQGSLQQRLGRARARQLLSFGAPDENTEKEISEIKAELEEYAGKRPAGLLPQMFYGGGTQAAQRRDQIGRGAAYAAMGVAAVGLAAATGGLSVPGTLMTGLGAYSGANALAAGASSVGFSTGASYEGFIQEAGLAYDELLEITGKNGEKLDPAVARAAALMVGAINAGIEFTQLSMFLKHFPGADKLIGRKMVKEAVKSPTVINLIKKAGKAGATWLKEVGLESGQEVVQQATNITARNAAKALSHGEFTYDTAPEIRDELLSTFGSSAIDFSLLMLAGPLTGGARNMARAAYMKRYHINRAQALSVLQQFVNEAAKQGPLASRSPQAAREFLVTLNDRLKNPFAKVYLPAAAVRDITAGMEAEKRAGTLKTLGVSEVEFSDALATGSDLVVNSVDFAMLAQSDESTAAGLFPRLKADAQGPENGSIKEATKKHADFIRNAISYVSRVISPAVSEEDLIEQAKAEGVGDVYVKASVLNQLFQEAAPQAAADEAQTQTAGVPAQETKSALAEGTGTQAPEAAQISGTFAGLSLDEALDAIGISRVDFDKALENDEDLQISIDRLLSGDLPKDLYGSLRDDLMAEAGGMTIRGARELEEAYADKTPTEGEEGTSGTDGVQAETAADSKGDAQEGKKGAAAQGAENWREKAERDIRDREGAYRVRANVKAQLLNAGVGDKVAQAQAELFSAHIMRSARRLGLDPETYFKIYANMKIVSGAVTPDSALNQPMNADVDVTEKVTGTVVHPKLSPEEATLVKKNKEKKAFAKRLTGVYHNESTGWDISLSVENVSHAVSTALSSPFGFETVVNILEALPQIIQRARLIETHPDRHDDSQVKNIHRMYASVRMAGRDRKTHTYTVKLTVKEMDGSYAAEIEGIYRAYDTNVVKEEAEKISDVKRGLLPHEEAPIRNTPDTYEITIGEMLTGVKDNNGNLYLQAAWHGSPFNFDRFSLEHINSGEGAQAFGWGLYFAGKREVSEGYRKRLSDPRRHPQAPKIFFDGEELKFQQDYETEDYDLVSPPKGINRAGIDALHNIYHEYFNYDRANGPRIDNLLSRTVSMLRQFVKKFPDEPQISHRSKEAADWIEANKDRIKIEEQVLKGQLYQVDIPDEKDGNYLLWDTKVTKEQAGRVVKALKEQGVPFFNDLALDGKNLSADNPDVLSAEFETDVASMLNIIWRNVENGKSLDDAISHARAIYEDDIRIAKVHKGMEDEETLADQAKMSQKNIDWLEANKNRLSLSETSSALFWGEKIFNESLSRVFAEDDGFERDAYAVLKDIAYSLKTEGMPLEQAIEKALFEYQVQIDMIEAEGIDAYGDERNELNMEATQARLNWLQENKDKISFRNISAAEAAVAKWSNRNGQFFYQQLERLLGSDKAASLLLKDAGFVGIKYLDGFSRRKGEGTYNYVIFDDNAVNILETYYQAIRDGKSEAEAAEAAAGVIRGAISIPHTFGGGTPIQITITKNADASTAVHEMSHYFLWEMEQLAQLLPQDAELQADLETTKKWLGWQEGQTGWTREQQEQWARGFEAYLREGKAPSTALARAFARFKGWLCDIYRSIKELNVEISDDMRGVFDRLLASEEETEAAMMLDGPSGITPEGEAAAAESDKSAAERIVAARGRDLTERRAESVKTDVLSKILRAAETAKKLRESKEAAEEMERITDEVRMMPVYRAIAAMRSGRLKLSDDRLIADHGPDVYEGLPEGVSGMDGKFSADEVAEEFGYGSGEELLAAIKLAPSVEEEVRARFEANHPEASLQEEARAAAEDAAYEDDALSELIAEREDIAEAAGTSDEDWAMIEAEHDAAKAAWDDPRSRPNCVRWIRKNGGLNYDSVKYVFGDEPAAELLRRCGPGLFGGKMTLDVAAESMTSEGAYFGQGNVNADQELYNVLMGDDPPLSPLEVARREGFAEARAYAKKRAEARRAAEAERAVEKAERKAQKEAAAAEKREKTEAEKQARREAREELKRRAAAAAEAVLSAARDAIDRLDPNRLEEKVETYKAAEAAAKKEYSEALHARDWERAGDAKDRQILNRALAVEARKAMKTVRNARERIMSQIRRSRKETSGMSQTWLDQIDLLFARFGIIPKSARMDSAQPLAKFIEGMEAAGYEPPVADWILNGLGPKGAREFTVGHLRDFDDTLAWLVHGAREAGRLSREWETRDLGAVANSVAANIRDKLSVLIEKRATATAERRNFDTTKAERAKRSIARCASKLSKIEMFCRVLDGGEPMGPAHMAIFEPIARAEAAESAMTRHYTQRFRELLDKSYSKKERRAMSKKRWYEMVGKNLTKEEVLCIALNTGNRENLNRIIKGFGWNEQQLRYVIETTLDGRDWDFVQGVWDLLDTLWPQIAALQRDISGWVPERVHAAARTWRVLGDTSGAGRTVAGGYYPIAYNREAGRNRFIRRITEQEALEDLYGGFWSLAQTKQGHTKERKENTGYELLLNLNVITTHFTNVIHDLTHRKAIIDVNKLLTYWEREEGAPGEGSRVVHPLEDAIIDAMGEETYDQFHPWLKFVARGEDNPLHAIDLAARWLRRRTQIVVLGLKAAVSLSQINGFFPAMHEVGFWPLMKNIFYFYRNPLALMENARAVWEKSEAMRTRSTSRDRDVRSLVDSLHRRGKFDSLQESYFTFINLFDAGVVIPIWTTAYEKGLHSGMDEDRAIAYADSVVRGTQDIGTPKDLSAIQRGRETYKIFTMFYNAMNTQLNMVIEDYWLARAGRVSRGHLIGTALYVIAMPAIFGALITGRGPKDEDDDDKGFFAQLFDDPARVAAWCAAQAAKYPFAYIPLLRDFMSYALGDSYRYRVSPAFEPALQAGKAVMDLRRAAAGENVSARTLAKDAFTTGGYLFGYPAGQLNITFGAIIDLMEGEDVRPADFFLAHKKRKK